MDYVRLKTTDGVSWQNNCNIGWGWWAFSIACLIIGAILIIATLNMRGKDRGQSEVKLDTRRFIGMLFIIAGIVTVFLTIVVRTTDNYQIYEGVGDSQHLLKPVASSTEN